MPGVEAVIDAVLAGDPGDAARQATTGIAVATADTDRIVVLGNLVVRNFDVGLEVQGNARVVVEGCRFDSNLAANVRVPGDGRLTMTGASVVGGGMRSTRRRHAGPGRRDPLPGRRRRHDQRHDDRRQHGVDVQGTVDVQPQPAVCPAPVVTPGVGPCGRCKTRNGVTTCRKCGITLQ